MTVNKKQIILMYVVGILSLTALAMYFNIFMETRVKYPIGKQIMAIISDQLSLGPRHVGSDGHLELRKYIRGSLEQSGVAVLEQVWTDPDGQELNNIIGRINPTKAKRIILGTHYDSKEKANLDPINPALAVPGANDSASGTALLLRLADDINSNPEMRGLGIDLVFFDAEEYQPGSYEMWRAKGSTYFADNIQSLYPEQKPILAINPDLVCDKNLRFYKDSLSVLKAGEETNAIWAIGRSIDRNSFDEGVKAEIKDDQTALIAAGIPSVLMIDLEYPAFHTTQDTIDKCSNKSLENVFETIRRYLITRA